jgi:hypothetical protein
VYAHLVRSGATDQTRAEMQQIVSDETVPALRDEPGFTGALSLVNRRSGEAIMIVLWRTADPRVAASPGDQRPARVWEVTLRV